MNENQTIADGERDLEFWFIAASQGDVDSLRAFLEEGFWTEARSQGEGMTALMIAASEGHDSAVELLAQESEIDARDAWGNTAALLAAAGGHARSLDALLKRGASSSAVNKSGVGIAAALARVHARRKTAERTAADWRDYFDDSLI